VRFADLTYYLVGKELTILSPAGIEPTFKV
jgi:hypothetical protein